MGFFDPLGLIDDAVDTIENAGEFALNVATFQYGDAMVTLADQQLFLGLDVTLGDVAAEVDAFLDDNPWLKTVIIVAAGAATGGTGALVAAAALTATDALAKAEDGEYTWDDFKGTAMEGASNFSTAVTAGGAGLATRAAQMQFASQVLSQMAAETELAPYVSIASGAMTMDWSTALKSAQNVGEIVASVAETQGEAELAQILRLASNASTEGIADIGEGVTLTVDALEAAGVVDARQAALVRGFVEAGRGGYTIQEGGGAAASLAAELGLVDDATAETIRSRIASTSDGLSAAEAADLATALAVELEVVDASDAARIRAAAAMAEGGLSSREAAMLANLALHEAGVYDAGTAAAVEDGIETLPADGALELEEILDGSLRSLADSGVLPPEASAALGLASEVTLDGEVTARTLDRLLAMTDLPPVVRGALVLIGEHIENGSSAEAAVERAAEAVNLSEDATAFLEARLVGRGDAADD